MSFGVDTLGGLADKLKQLVNDTQATYESFVDATQLYKQGKMPDREFFNKIGEFLVANAALNFLAVRVILELKSALEKGTSIKSPTGGPAYSGPSQTGFGVGGFVSTGGMAGPAATKDILPSPSVSTFRPVDIELSKPKADTKNCIICGSTIPQRAKFCSKCGRAQ
jgi:hypothetical protein